MYLYKLCLCHRNQQNIKGKMLVEKFFFIDQDTYWTPPNGCLNFSMFYLGKSICRSMEYSHRIITRNKFKTSYKLATVFQLKNCWFSCISPKYVCKAVPCCTKVPSSKFISNVAPISLRKFVFVRKFVSVPMFAQSVGSPSYRVVNRCDFDLVNKANINTSRSVSVCCKVSKSLLTLSILQHLML